MASDELQQHDRFRIDQLVRPIVNLYRVAPLAAGEVPLPPVAFVRQKRMAFREDIRFFADENEFDLSGDTEKRVDRRLGIALGIGLDALQNR